MSAESKSIAVENEGTKQCCARLYESDVARFLLGESFHPGGLKLTERLGQLLHLTPNSRVLDVASGNGASAIFLAERFGCEVFGMDYSAQNVERASEQATAKKLSGRVHFQRADAESLPVADASFDAIICECAFCTFPDKAATAREFSRVLHTAGCVGLSDLTRARVLPKELDSLLAWIACIADAQPMESYEGILRSAGLTIQHREIHDDALRELVQQVCGKLLGVEIMAGLKKLDLPGVDFSVAKQMAASALAAIERRELGYAIFIAVK